MNNIRLFNLKTFMLLLLLIGYAGAARAVTDKEMDEARAITAKLYLRWTNNGSDYLDNLNPKSMSELNGKLKAKEKENIKAFIAADRPGDYSKWGKEELVKYWSETFFKAPGLSEKGKGARSRVKSKIQAMNIAKPEESKEGNKPEATQQENSAMTGVDSAAMAPVAAVDDATAKLDAQADSIAAEREALAETTPKKSNNYTSVYIIILAILVAVVIFLVVYASKVMSKNNNRQESQRRRVEADEPREERPAETRRPAAASPAPTVSRGMVDAEQYAVLQSRYDAAIAENSRLSNELTTARGRIHQLTEELSALQTRRQRELETSPAPAPRRAARRDEPQASTIYLGRVNNQGLFVRADRRFNPESSIYALRTSDGYTGTFRVVDDEDVFDRALSDPERHLMEGCTGEMLDDTEGCSRIITETPGTAIFEDGCWRLLRKAHIAYE